MLRTSARVLVLLGVACAGLVPAAACRAGRAAAAAASADTLRLPAPRAKGPLALEEALATRRSVRQWAPGALKLEEVGQLAWAAQGTTSAEGKRTAPSAMARYPLELYLVASAVDGLAPGVYRYLPKGHALVRVAAEDRRAAVAGATRGQGSVATAPLVVVIAAVPARFGARTDARTDRFIALEAGAAMQNLLLEATALHLGAVPVGGYASDDALAEAVPLAAGERPMIVVPVGRRS